MSPRRATNKDFGHSLINNSGVPLGPATTSFSVVDGSQFPDTANGEFTIRFPATGEVCTVHTRVGNAFTSVTRGLPEGATAITVNDGSEVDESFGAQDIADIEEYEPLHASTHGSAGSDPVSLNGAQITAGTIATARLALYYPPVTTKVANYTILPADHTTLFLANAASLVFTLPVPATAGSGFTVTIKNKNQTTTGVKTNTAGVLIDGVDCSATTYTTGLTVAWGHIVFITDGVAWFTV